MISFCKLLVLVHAVLRVECQFRMVPQNAAVKKNHMARHTFHCKLAYSKAQLDDLLHNPPEGGLNVLSWSKSFPNKGAPEPFTFGDHLFTDYENEYALHYKDGNGVQYDFKVPLKNLDYSGNYSCNFIMIPRGQLKQYARFVILDSDPICNMYPAGKMMEGDVVTFRCEVRYKGYLYPQMRWTGDDLHNHTDKGSLLGEIKKSSITVTVTARHHAKSVKVLTFFSKPKEIEIDQFNLTFWANNAPAYEYTHTFPSMNVYYGARNVIISPADDVFTLNQVLTCAADSNPLVDTYIWTDNTLSNMQPRILKQGFDASSIMLTSELLDRDTVTFRCTVRNTLFNQETKSAFVEHTFRLSKTTTTNPTTTTKAASAEGQKKKDVNETTLAVIMGAGALVVVGVLAMMYVIGKKKGSRDPFMSPLNRSPTSKAEASTPSPRHDGEGRIRPHSPTHGAERKRPRSPTGGAESARPCSPTRGAESIRPRSPTGGAESIRPRSPTGGARSAKPCSPTGGAGSARPRSPTGGAESIRPRSPTGGLERKSSHSPTGGVERTHSSSRPTTDRHARRHRPHSPSGAQMSSPSGTSHGSHGPSTPL